VSSDHGATDRTNPPNRARRRHPNKAFSPARRRYVTINETADYLGVTERTVRQMIVDGRLVGYRMGNRFIRLDLDEIDAAMQPFGGAL
jgi:excisionase family DNA binding protein